MFPLLGRVWWKPEAEFISQNTFSEHVIFHVCVAFYNVWRPV